MLRSFALLALILCLGQNAMADSARVDSLSLSQGRQALLRSMALSGWGQAYNGEWVKAAVFAGIELGIVLSAHHQHQQWQDFKDRSSRERALIAAGTGSEAALAYYLKSEDLYLRDRNKLIWWWLWSKLACSLDAYVTGSISNFDVQWADHIRLEPVTLAGSASGISLCITLD